MYRPEVRIIQNQEVESHEKEVSQSEMNELLAKYGYSSGYTGDRNQQPVNPNQNLTFEEMMAREEQKENQRLERERQLRNGPKPVSFDPNNIGYSETKYSSMEVDDWNSLGIKVEIVSDMKIPR